MIIKTIPPFFFFLPNSHHSTYVNIRQLELCSGHGRVLIPDYSSFYEASITLIRKPDRDITKKKIKTQHPSTTRMQNSLTKY